uniref:Putative secreted peptide n=1 Tax=Rhipicephalus pulchellus TaxID=72859 RepID=L7M9H6_RHIPC
MFEHFAVVLTLLVAGTRGGEDFDPPPTNTENALYKFWSSNDYMWTYRSNNPAKPLCRKEKRIQINKSEVNLTESLRATSAPNLGFQMWSFTRGLDRKYPSMALAIPNTTRLYQQTLLYHNQSGPCGVILYEVLWEKGSGSDEFYHTKHYNLLARGNPIQNAAMKCVKQYETYVKRGVDPNDATFQVDGCDN